MKWGKLFLSWEQIEKDIGIFWLTLHKFYCIFQRLFHWIFLLCSFGHILTLISYFMFLIGIGLPFKEKNEMAEIYVDQLFGNVTKLLGSSYNILKLINNS